MTDLLIKLFVKNPDEVSDPVVRQKYGTLSGGVGIGLNLLLALSKFIVGTFITHSIAISADAVNNFSDAASSLLTAVGFRIAGKEADNEHPFGHGRFEYITALGVGIAVVLMGFELLRTSFGKIRSPEEVSFSYAAAAVLAISIVGKIWLALFNGKIGKMIQSPALTAAAKDSISDSTSTAIALVSLFVSKLTSFNIDGWAGMIVAGFILYTGIGILKETTDMLLGTAPDEMLVKDLSDCVLSYDKVKGIHDLVIHSYGAGTTFATLHAEFSAEEDIMQTHDLVDRIEQRVLAEYGVHMVIHMDPLVFDDERISYIRQQANEIIHSMDERFALHDLRVVDGPTHTNIIFDLVIPHKYEKSAQEIREQADRLFKEKDSRYFTVITVEYSYVNR